MLLLHLFFSFFFNDTAPTEIYTLSLHDALPIFIVNAHPPDIEIIPVSRTVGTDSIVDEMIVKFTHTCVIDHLLPGIPPTGRSVEIPVVGVVQFRDGKLASEHIYWDQASVLVQIGKLDPAGLPIAGVEIARKVLDKTLPSNRLMAREWQSSEGKPI